MLFRMKHPNLVILTSSQTLRRNLLFQPLTLHKRISWVSMLKTAKTPGVDSFSECVNPQRVIVQVVTREEIFFPEGCNTLEFSENRGVNSASSSQSDLSSDPGLKTSKKRSRNPKRCKRNIMKKAKVEGSCYITSSGKVKSPRKQVPPCSCPRKRYW